MNEKGSILTTVLLLAGLLILLALPVLQVANAGYKTSVNEQVKTQAFYLAEAGKEHLVQLAMDKLKEVAATIATQVPISLQENKSLGSGFYSATATISHHQGNQYLVEVVSTGKVSSLSQVARQTILVTIVPGSETGNLPSGWALFIHYGSLPAIGDDGKITIIGPMGTSSETGISYSQVSFPSFSEQKTITNNKIEVDGHYNAINLKKDVLIITTSEDEVRVVRVPSINLENEAVIQVRGNGSLLLYVDGDVSSHQDCKLTETPNGAVVEIYSGGTFYTSKGNNSNPEHLLMQRTMLFAPQAIFDADNHVRADGAIIVGTIINKQHLHLQHSEVFADPDFKPIGYTSSPQIIIEQELWSPRLP